MSALAMPAGARHQLEWASKQRDMDRRFGMSASRVLNLVYSTHAAARLVQTIHRNHHPL